jgi:hypothetical protein
MEFNPLEKKFIDQMLPEGAIPTSIVTILTYLDTTGENSWLMWVESDAPVTAVVGALELAKIDIIASTPGSSTISQVVADWNADSEEWYEIDIDDEGQDDY